METFAAALAQYFVELEISLQYYVYSLWVIYIQNSKSFVAYSWYENIFQD